MRNKSRKRILHEQRVQIEELRRELEAHKHARRPVMTAQEYEPQKIEIEQYIAPYLPARRFEEVKKRVHEESIKQITDAIVRDNKIERTETTLPSGITSVRYRLIIMQRRH